MFICFVTFISSKENKEEIYPDFFCKTVVCHQHIISVLTGVNYIDTSGNEIHIKKLQ